MAVTWRGVRLDERTAAMMDEVARLAGDLYISPSQGSWSGAPASAGTHNGCGAIDLMRLSSKDFDTVVEIMRSVGFAAWKRTVTQANWPLHVHGIAVQPGGKNDRGCLSSGAHKQIVDYYENRNGLVSGAPDDATRAHVGTTWETYLEEDMPLSDDDIDRIAERAAVKVWNAAFDVSGQPGKKEAANWFLRIAQRDAEAARKNTD